MRMIDIILKKRNGIELDSEEIDYFVQGYTAGKIPDYQISALLMAIYFRGMSRQETADLTKSMIASGNTMELKSINGIKIDKHSSGGVGDKTTLVVGPMVAACGVPITKMSGRGLGHTGGTIDKLESIPNFSVELPINKFINNVNGIGLAICSQTENIVPADKKLYALRDVTATTDNISLIASSIMSKKIASGADAIVLDVKVGSGAFMKTYEDALELAGEMVDIGKQLRRKTVAVISDMDQPLGRAVGNSVEVYEAVEALKGNGPKDLMELCISLGSIMLVLANKAKNNEEAAFMLENTIKTGSALKKLKEFVKAQDGDIRYIESPELLLESSYKHEIVSDFDGVVQRLDAETVGISSLLLGAGRETKESKIDHSAGIILNKKIGDRVKKGDVLAELFCNNKERIKPSAEKLKCAYHISERPADTKKIIYTIIGL